MGSVDRSGNSIIRRGQRGGVPKGEKKSSSYFCKNCRGSHKEEECRLMRPA